MGLIDDAARARSVRATLSVVGLLAGLVLGGCGATAAPPARCLVVIHDLQVSTQGTGGSAFIGVEIRKQSPGACTLEGELRVSVLKNGRLANVQGNPEPVGVRLRLHAHQYVSALVAWTPSWCGSKRSITFRVTYGSLRRSGHFNTLPDCLGKGRGSSLELAQPAVIASNGLIGDG